MPKAMRLIALTLLCTFCLTARAATTITGGVLAASDTTGTNARPSAVTITARTNLASGTLQVTNVVTLGAGATAATLQTDTNGTIRVTSAASDGNSALTLDTSSAHTSGNLVEVKNNGTNVITVELGIQNSDIRLVSPVISSAGATASLHTYGDPSLGEVSLDLDSGNNSSAHLIGSTGSEELWIANVNGVTLDFWPSAGSSSTAYLFDTLGVSHISGNVSEFNNNGTNVVQITATTATSTNTPFILNINGTQKPVWLGPPDSGGTGLRALTVAN